MFYDNRKIIVDNVIAIFEHRSILSTAIWMLLPDRIVRVIYHLHVLPSRSEFMLKGRYPLAKEYGCRNREFGLPIVIGGGLGWCVTVFILHRQNGYFPPALVATGAFLLLLSVFFKTRCLCFCGTSPSPGVSATPPIYFHFRSAQRESALRFVRLVIDQIVRGASATTPME
jgi:hypothetical protein